MGKLIPFLFIALDGKSAVAHLRLRIPGHKLRGSWFSFRWSPVRIVIGFSFRAVRGSRLNPAGSGDLRPLQAKSETHCLMLFSATI